MKPATKKFYKSATPAIPKPGISLSPFKPPITQPDHLDPYLSSSPALPIPPNFPGNPPSLLINDNLSVPGANYPNNPPDFPQIVPNSRLATIEEQPISLEFSGNFQDLPSIHPPAQVIRPPQIGKNQLSPHQIISGLPVPGSAKLKIPKQKPNNYVPVLTKPPSRNQGPPIRNIPGPQLIVPSGPPQNKFPGPPKHIPPGPPQNLPPGPPPIFKPSPNLCPPPFPRVKSSAPSRLGPPQPSNLGPPPPSNLGHPPPSIFGPPPLLVPNANMPPPPNFNPPPYFSSHPPNLNYIPPPLFFNPSADYKLDSNVIEISLSELKSPQKLSTGDPIQCPTCSAYLSIHSKVSSTWTCEFCLSSLDLDLDPEELPKAEKLLYIKEVQSISTHNKTESKTAVFCIDTSGSMCVTVPVAGVHSFKAKKLLQTQQELYNIVGPEWMAMGAQGVTYISRLECVQVAIETQLNSLLSTSPTSKVGLIAFNNEVSMIGDGSNSIKITGDHLNSTEALTKLSSNTFNTLLRLPIIESKEGLTEKLMSLEEEGSTALGPALLVSVILAAQAGPGSKVILCTDGIANTGVGNLEDLEELDFYNEVTQIAKESGVEVSILSISDENCRLDALMTVVEGTGGELSKVSPVELGADFANILSNEVFAVNVVVTVRLPKGLKFVNMDPAVLISDNLLRKNFGSVSNESMFTFEFSVDQDIQQAVIQTDIEYKDLKGNKFVLVQTQIFEVSEDYEEVIKDANFDVLGKNAQLQGANLMKKGDLYSAEQNFSKWNAVMSSNARTEVQQDSFGAMIKKTSHVQNSIRQEILRNEDEFAFGELSDRESNMRFQSMPMDSGNKYVPYGIGRNLPGSVPPPANMPIPPPFALKSINVPNLPNPPMLNNMPGLPPAPSMQYNAADLYMNPIGNFSSPPLLSPSLNLNTDPMISPNPYSYPPNFPPNIDMQGKNSVVPGSFHIPNQALPMPQPMHKIPIGPARSLPSKISDKLLSDASKLSRNTD